MQFEIRFRRTHKKPIAVEIECAADADYGVKLREALGQALEANADLTGADLKGINLRDALLRGADLSDVDLRKADLRGAALTGTDLTGADLREVDLRDADMAGATLTGADLRGAILPAAPKIDNIHRTVYAAASRPGALDMEYWHTSETTHSRAGWVVTSAGDAGLKLEESVGTATAAILIYLASDPTIDRVPDFYSENAEALADMKRLADAEEAR